MRVEGPIEAAARNNCLEQFSERNVLKSNYFFGNFDGESDLENWSECLSEDNCFVSIEKHAILQVSADTARKHNFFQVAAFLQQVVQGVPVRDAGDVLLDDGAIVQDFGDVVAGRAD